MKGSDISFDIDGATFVVTNNSNQIITTAYPKHCHDKNSYEIHYIPVGYGTVIIDEVSYDVSPNTLYITGPNVMHEQTPHPHEPMIEYGMNIDVLSKKSSSQDAHILNTFLSTVFWFGQDKQNVSLVFKQIFEELAHRLTGYSAQLEALCKMLVILLIRNYDTSTYHINNLPKLSLTAAKNLTVEEAFLYEYKTITIDTLSAKIGLSNRQTERLLKEQYGKTFLQKRTEARMSAALILLESKRIVSQVAEIVGHSSCEHFTNAFKQFYGASPRKYMSDRTSGSGQVFLAERVASLLPNIYKR